MQPSQGGVLDEGHASIADVVGIKEQTLFQRFVSSQAFWVAVALFVLIVFMTWLEPSFGTSDNVTNITRNFAPIAIMGLGMTVVLITGGIDLSVGSVMGLVAIVAGLLLTWHYPWYVAFSAGLLAGLGCGAFNGFFVAYIGMPSFVVTLGMLSIARSLAIVLSGNQMLYQFGPDAPIVKAIGQAKWPLHQPAGWAPHWMPELSSHFWVMVVLALIVGFVFNFTAWARHLFAIGGNESRRADDRRAGRLDQVPSLPVLSLHRLDRLAAAARLQRLGHQCDGNRLRTARHSRHRHWRREPDGRLRHGIRSGDRLGLP